VTAETNVGVVYSGGIADSSGVADRARLLGTPDFAESPEPTCSIGGGLQSNDDFCDGPAETVIHHGPCRSDEGGLVQRSIEGNLRRKYKTWRWIDATLKAAMAAVEAGEWLKTVARYFDIPPTSLSDHLFGRTLGRKRGPPTILQKDEESALTTYMGKMQDYGHPLTMPQLRLKVATITQERVTPFREGIPGKSWVRWFKKRHPDLTLRSSQGLEFARARGLCPENVASFYGNLQDLYNTNKYTTNNIWNCDESGAQAGRNGGGLV
jgi:hypothetical protein